MRAGGQRRLARICLRGSGWLLVSASVLLAGVDAHAHAKHVHHRQHQARIADRKHSSTAAVEQSAAMVLLPTARPGLADLSPDLAAVKQALDLIKQGEIRAATEIEKSATNPVARKLIEWALLRRADGVEIQRYVDFHCQPRLAGQSVPAQASGINIVAGWSGRSCCTQINRQRALKPDW